MNITIFTISFDVSKLHRTFVIASTNVRKTLDERSKKRQRTLKKTLMHHWDKTNAKSSQQIVFFFCLQIAVFFCQQIYTKYPKRRSKAF